MGQRELTSLSYVRVKVFSPKGFRSQRREAMAFGVATDGVGRVAIRGEARRACDVTKAPLLLTEWSAKAAIVQQKMGLRALNACNWSSNSTVGTCDC